MQKVLLAALLAAVCFVAAALGTAFVVHSLPTPKLGSASDNVLTTYPTVTKVFVAGTDTLVIASSTGRTYLELQNASGATTTAQIMSCNFGDRPATLYQGLSIFPTSTKQFALDNLYRGAIHCIAPAAGALLTITDF